MYHRSEKTEDIKGIVTDMKNEYDIRKLQLMQLDILKEVKRVCELHNFTFYIMNGTCLGAVRHHGSIPWDDDIDIGMYAETFDQFVRCQNDFGPDYFIQTVKTDPEFRTMIARVRLKGTTIIEKEFEDCDINHGVFIDIYPLFGYPDNLVLAQIRSWESLLYRLLLADRPPQNHGRAAVLIGMAVHKCIPSGLKKKIIRRIHRRLRSEPNNSRYVAFLYGMDVHLFHTIKYERAWFSKPSKLSYESLMLPGPTDWDSYLKIRYHDYMKLPPKDKRESYHSFEFVDLEHPYQIYKGKKYLRRKK